MDVSSVPLQLTIHDLPNEIIDNIFRHLAIRDVGRCMMVSRKWHSIGCKIKIKEIIYKNTDERYSFYDKWTTTELFDEKMVLSNSNLSKPLTLDTTYLTRLALYNNDSHDFRLHDLNVFLHLQHLELNYFYPRFYRHQRTTTLLNLPNLQIVLCRSVRCKLEFNTPALTSIYIWGSKKVRFRNLLTLRLLQYETFLDGDSSWFNRIESVEVFRMKYNQNLHIFCNALEQLVNVMEMRCNFYHQDQDTSINGAYLESWVTKILKQRKISNKPNVKVYLFDMLLVDGKKFEEYEFQNVDRLLLY